MLEVVAKDRLSGTCYNGGVFFFQATLSGELHI